jgi:hypothetical protein
LILKPWVFQRKVQLNSRGKSEGLTSLEPKATVNTIAYKTTDVVREVTGLLFFFKSLYTFTSTKCQPLHLEWY